MDMPKCEEWPTYFSPDLVDVPEAKRNKVGQWRAADSTYCHAFSPPASLAEGSVSHTLPLFSNSADCSVFNQGSHTSPVKCSLLEILCRETHSEALRGAKETATNYSSFCVAPEILAMPPAAYSCLLAWFLVFCSPIPPSPFFQGFLPRQS